MFKDKKVIVIVPAYNAEQTLRQTYDEVMAQGIVDQIIVVDDGSSDKTTATAKTLPKTIVHTHPENQGYRAFSWELLEKLPLKGNSDDFVFDNQVLAQILWLDYRIAEVSCPTKYFAEASFISFQHSTKYGFGCLNTATKYRLAKMHLIKSRLFPRR